MSRPITLHFYEDPGHGWLRAPTKLLEDLQIVGQISPYSYLLGQHAYLEEDRDAGKLIEALKQDCAPYKVVRHYCKNESAIRNYPSFSTEMAKNMAKVPVAGMYVSYGGNRLTLARPTTGGAWYVESDTGMHYLMKRRQVMEATAL